MLVNNSSSGQFFQPHTDATLRPFVRALMASIVFGFVAVAVAVSLIGLRAGHFDESNHVLPPVIRAVIADATIGFDGSSDELRRCWVPSDTSEPRDCWIVPGEPAKEQRLRIDGDGSLEDCWPHPDESDVDICESPQMAFVV